MHFSHKRQTRDECSRDTLGLSFTYDSLFGGGARKGNDGDPHSACCELWGDAQTLAVYPEAGQLPLRRRVREPESSFRGGGWATETMEPRCQGQKVLADIRKCFVINFQNSAYIFTGQQISTLQIYFWEMK